jgi:hypothetical protein
MLPVNFNENEVTINIFIPTNYCTLIFILFMPNYLSFICFFLGSRSAATLDQESGG